LLFTLQWAELGEDSLVGPEGDLRSLFDFQRAIYGACSTFLTSRSPVADYSLILDPLQKQLGASIFVAHTLVSLISRYPAGIDRQNEKAVPTDGSSVSRDPSLLSARLADLVSHIWNISTSGSSKIPTENLQSLLAIVIDVISCVGCNDYQLVSEPAVNPAIFAKTLWNIFVVCPGLLELVSTIDTNLVKTNRVAVLASDRVVVLKRLIKCLGAINPYSLTLYTYKIAALPSWQRQKLGTACVRLLVVDTEDRSASPNIPTSISTVIKQCFQDVELVETSADLGDAISKLPELLRLLKDIQRTKS
jgi:hypothetical protein